MPKLNEIGFLNPNVKCRITYPISWLTSSRKERIRSFVAEVNKECEFMINSTINIYEHFKNLPIGSWLYLHEFNNSLSAQWNLPQYFDPRKEDNMTFRLIKKEENRLLFRLVQSKGNTVKYDLAKFFR